MTTEEDEINLMNHEDGTLFLTVSKGIAELAVGYQMSQSPSFDVWVQETMRIYRSDGILNTSWGPETERSGYTIVKALTREEYPEYYL